MLVKILDRASGAEEWGLVEFQGELVGELQGKTLGRLDILQDGRAEIDIGQQFLEGSVVTLKAPLLIVADDDSAGASKDLAVVGVVRKKVLFNTRPKPSNQVKRLRI